MRGHTAPSAVCGDSHRPAVHNPPAASLRLLTASSRLCSHAPARGQTGTAAGRQTTGPKRSLRRAGRQTNSAHLTAAPCRRRRQAGRPQLVCVPAAVEVWRLDADWWNGGSRAAIFSREGRMTGWLSKHPRA